MKFAVALLLCCLAGCGQSPFQVAGPVPPPPSPPAYGPDFEENVKDLIELLAHQQKQIDMLQIEVNTLHRELKNFKLLIVPPIPEVDESNVPGPPNGYERSECVPVQPSDNDE